MSFGSEFLAIHLPRGGASPIVVSQFPSEGLAAHFSQVPYHGDVEEWKKVGRLVLAHSICRCRGSLAANTAMEVTSETLMGT